MVLSIRNQNADNRNILFIFGAIIKYRRKDTKNQQEIQEKQREKQHIAYYSSSNINHPTSITQHLLPITYHLLPITRYLSPVTYHLSPITYYL